MIKTTEQAWEKISNYAILVEAHFIDSSVDDHTGTFSTSSGVFFCIKSAARSASIITGALRFPLTIDGITDASATFK